MGRQGHDLHQTKRISIINVRNFPVNGGLGVSIMGDLDEAQRSRSPPRGHPKRLFGDFWAVPKVTRRRNGETIQMQKNT